MKKSKEKLKLKLKNRRRKLIPFSFLKLSLPEILFSAKIFIKSLHNGLKRIKYPYYSPAFPGFPAMFFPLFLAGLDTLDQCLIFTLAKF